MDRCDEPFVEEWGAPDAPALLLVHGSNAPDPAATWRSQRPLANEGWRLLVLHRRGYGQSLPQVDKPDFALDTADIVRLLARHGPLHLVGFSYGGVLSLLAACERPELVRTLTLVEPPAYAVARDDALVAATIERMAALFARDAHGALPPEEQFIRGFRALLGIRPANPGPLAPADRQAIRATLLEPPPAEAAIPLAQLAGAPFPILVFSGAWNAALTRVAERLAGALHAEHIVLPGAGHNVHSLHEPFNARLRELLASSSPR